MKRDPAPTTSIGSQHAEYVACSGTGQVAKRRPKDGYWVPCPVCGREMLPRFGGIMPRHRRDWDAEPTLYDPDTGTHEA